MKQLERRAKRERQYFISKALPLHKMAFIKVVSLTSKRKLLHALMFSILCFVVLLVAFSDLKRAEFEKVFHPAVKTVFVQEKKQHVIEFWHHIQTCRNDSVR